MGPENRASRRCVIVAVDGPAGSGKSSVCSKVCQRLGWTYVNTGFLYRAIAHLCQQRFVAFDNNDALVAIIDSFAKGLNWDAETQAVWYEGRDLAPFLYTDQAGKDASLIAKNPLVREKLLPLQRKLALLSPVGAIVDGRDIGTVVFPDADLKIFMTASLEERARRRMHQLKDGAKASADEIEALKKSIGQRDSQDAARGTAPLKQADDAILLDTSNMGLEGSIDFLVHLIKDKGLA